MIKAIKRVGFGYKDFDVFRAKILHVDDEDKPFKNKSYVRNHCEKHRCQELL